MQDFQFYVTDNRYGVPSIMFVQTKDADAARDLARRILQETFHHRRIDVLCEGEVLFSVSAEAADVGGARQAGTANAA